MTQNVLDVLAQIKALRPLRSDGASYIPLTDGLFALVDASDLPLLERYTWYPQRGRNTWYVRSDVAAYGVREVILMHRLLLGATPIQDVDHKNHNGLDNRRANLRFCSQSQNSANVPKYNRESNHSQWKGVSFDKHSGKWTAYIGVERAMKNLGHFKTEIEAARAYNAAALKYFGSFAVLNEVSE